MQVSHFRDHVLLHAGQAAYVENVPLYKRLEPHAGFASLGMVLHYWNKPNPLEQIRQWFDLQSLQEPDPAPLFERYAFETGLWAHFTQGSMEVLKERIRNGVPVIVLLQFQPLDPLSWQCAVVTGFDDVSRQILCQDGGRVPSVYGYDTFIETWTGAMSWMLTLCPPDYPQWRLRDEELLSRGRYYEWHHQYDSAITDFEELSRRLPGESGPYVNLASAHYSAGRIGQAEQLYRKALELNERDARACNNLAYLLAEESRGLDEAVQLAKRATLLEPRNARFIDTLGYAYYKGGDYDNSSKALESARSKALRLPPGPQTDIAMHLVESHLKAGNEHLARQVLADALRIDPNLFVPYELRRLLRPQDPAYR
ncbi:MAG: hypothetical protein KJ626_09775 [Verrucomicrobia bacterium]|nr:hypothetical protein [Verrucomicrobiota bacterium]